MRFKVTEIHSKVWVIVLEGNRWLISEDEGKANVVLGIDEDKKALGKRLETLGIETRDESSFISGNNDFIRDKLLGNLRGKKIYYLDEALWRDAMRGIPQKPNQASTTFSMRAISTDFLVSAKNLE